MQRCPVLGKSVSLCSRQNGEGRESNEPRPRQLLRRPFPFVFVLVPDRILALKSAACEPRKLCLELVLVPLRAEVVQSDRPVERGRVFVRKLTDRNKSVTGEGER